jgi:hypothetical protein
MSLFVIPSLSAVLKSKLSDAFFKIVVKCGDVIRALQDPGDQQIRTRSVSEIITSQSQPTRQMAMGNTK